MKTWMTELACFIIYTLTSETRLKPIFSLYIYIYI